MVHIQQILPPKSLGHSQWIIGALGIYFPEETLTFVLELLLNPSRLHSLQESLSRATSQSVPQLNIELESATIEIIATHHPEVLVGVVGALWEEKSSLKFWGWLAVALTCPTFVRTRKDIWEYLWEPSWEWTSADHPKVTAAMQLMLRERLGDLPSWVVLRSLLGEPQSSSAMDISDNSPNLFVTSTSHLRMELLNWVNHINVLLTRVTRRRESLSTNFKSNEWSSMASGITNSDSNAHSSTS